MTKQNNLKVIAPIILGVLLLVGIFALYTSQNQTASVISSSQITLDSGQSYFLVSLNLDDQNPIIFQKGTTVTSPDGTSKYTVNKEIKIVPVPTSSQLIAPMIKRFTGNNGELQGCSSTATIFGTCVTPFGTGLTPYTFGTSAISSKTRFDVYIDGALTDSKVLSLGANSVGTISSTSDSQLSIAGDKVRISGYAISSINQQKPAIEGASVAFDSKQNAPTWTPSIAKSFYDSGSFVTLGNQFYACPDNHLNDCYAWLRDIVYGKTQVTSPGYVGGYVQGSEKFDGTTATWDLTPGYWSSQATVSISTQYADKILLTDLVAKPQVTSFTVTPDLAYQKYGTASATIKNNGVNAGQVSVTFSSADISVSSPGQTVQIAAGASAVVSGDILGQNSGTGSKNYCVTIKACGMSQFSSTSCDTRQACGIVEGSSSTSGTGNNAGGSTVSTDCSKYGPNYSFDQDSKTCKPIQDNTLLYVIIGAAALVGAAALLVGGKSNKGGRK